MIKWLKNVQEPGSKNISLFRTLVSYNRMQRFKTDVKNQIKLL